MIVGKDFHYKVFRIGSEDGNGGVGILLAEEWVEKFMTFAGYLIVL